MRNIPVKLNNIIKGHLPVNSKAALLSSFISVITASIISLTYYTHVHLNNNIIQPYHDIAVGNITLDGIYKDVDFNTYFIFIITYILLFFLLNKVLNKVKFKDYMQNSGALQVVVGLVPLFLVIIFRMNSIPKLYICFILYLVIMILWMKNYFKNEYVIKNATSIYCIYLSLSGLFGFVNYYFPQFADRGAKYFVVLLWTILFVYSFILYALIKSGVEGRKEKFINPILTFSQLIIPLNLFGLINTRFFYQGLEYNPVYYGRFKQIVLVAILLLLLSTIYNFIKSLNINQRIYEVSLSTIISVVVISFWNSSYNLVINPDQFHTGETAVVYQQVVELGQKWNTEFVSVLQGLGLTLSGFNKLIFGGMFSTYSQSQNLFMILIAIVTVALLYHLMEEKWLMLLITPIMPIFWMDRTYLIVPTFLLLINPKIVKSPIKWTYCYIVTCIIHVWYQPSYGGAVAAALMPVFLLIWYRAIRYNQNYDIRIKKNRTKIVVVFLSVVVIGILCIPMLLSVFHFLKVNGYETVITNGISVMQSMGQDPIVFTGNTISDNIIQFLFKFGTGLASIIIFVYMFARYVIVQRDQVKFIQGIILTFSAIIAYIMMLPAMLTRVDPGMSRIGVTGLIFYGFIVMILLYLYRSDVKYKTLFYVFFGLSISTGLYIIYPPYLQYHEKVNTVVNIPDDSIYVTPEETGLKNLGYAFIPNEQYLKEAMVLNEMCNTLLKDGQTYYDMTDKSIYYLFTNRKIPGLYASPLVVSNEKIQNDVIKQLDKNDIPFVYINQPLRYIGVSESLRSYRIYRYFIEKDYSFVRYKGCDFLVRGDMDLSSLKDYIEYYNTNVIGKHDDTIEESLYNTNKLSEVAFNNIVATNSITVVEDKLTINGSDPYVIYNIDGQFDLSLVQMIEIKLVNKPTPDMRGQLFIETENVTHNETNSIQFEIKSDKILIPLYQYLQFNLTSKIKNVRLDFDSVADGTDVPVDSIKLYSLDESQINNLNQKYSSLSSNITDIRLDNLFHMSNLENLPNQWGDSFDLLKDRFTLSASVTIDESKLSVTDSTKSIHYNLNNSIPGDIGELLKLEFDYSDNKKRNATVIVNGIDAKGNIFSEEFHLITVDGTVLIPISSSPNCLRANELISFDINYYVDQEQLPYDVSLKEAQFYQLVQ